MTGNNKSSSKVTVMQPFMLGPYTSPRRKMYSRLEGVFGEDELDRIVALGEHRPLETGIVGGSGRGQERPDIRVSKLGWITTDQAPWIYERLASAVCDLNDRYFRFDLFGFCEQLQYSTYEAPNGHYTWHVDNGGMRHPRKISFSLALSKVSSYEGGEFEIWEGGEPQCIRLKRGELLAFASFCMHRVRPVTSGLRQTLVGWVNGPDFR